jgi:hypothetical protein
MNRGITANNFRLSSSFALVAAIFFIPGSNQSRRRFWRLDVKLEFAHRTQETIPRITRNRSRGRSRLHRRLQYVQLIFLNLKIFKY